MRVKTMPRHLTVNKNVTSNECTTDNLEMNSSENSNGSVDANKEASDCPAEALDLTAKQKVVESQNDNGNHCSIGDLSTSCKDCGPISGEDSDECNCSDDKNNNYLPNSNGVHSSNPAGPSCVDDSKSCEQKTNASSHDDRAPPKAVNLCKKDRCEDEPPNSSENKQLDTKHDSLLYQFLTDPTFFGFTCKNKKLRQYECQFCKQNFVNSDQLADHMDAKKNSADQLVCCACKKTFAYKRYLKYHQKCHSDKTKYTCNICTKKYTRIDNLTRHNMIHVNPNKFNCPHCRKTFTRKDLLNKHLKCHDDENRVFCEICQKDFAAMRTLEDHRKCCHSAT
ncbi:zinc finger protein 62-like [Hylaeus anthracinus]|uniref:zinc finger protein 62-like n=1 Tax=Hylaeus anthracinus TaxID=313031 RepID=UPI0023B9C9D2|nr:zinc finger protein 62-like [Hylaeus anthracinus]XP_054004723.1 zinc finger protein 62-like [Hylaeus anthracinus]XP_054004724.1 zinc finger protein 62-like [Hylaeus anthracinus]XP_054004725.1 zinc finger protein 62-like [Hylaeus anthracinus]